MRFSKVFTGPMTSMGEKKREEEIEKTISPSVFETIREVEGVIYEVHEEKTLVKVYNQIDGSVVANSNWIPLSHSPQEIAERFGTIRVGMVVKVSYQGVDGQNARASIIYNEQEKPGEEEFALNEIETGLYEIFKPGA